METKWVKKGMTKKYMSYSWTTRNHTVIFSKEAKKFIKCKTYPFLLKNSKKNGYLTNLIEQGNQWRKTLRCVGLHRIKNSHCFSHSDQRRKNTFRENKEEEGGM